MPNSAHRPVALRWAWALFACAAVAAVAAAALATMHTRAAPAEAEPAIARSLPVTIPPQTTPPRVETSSAADRTTLPSAAPPTPSTTPTSTSPALSPLADLLGQPGSVIPPRIEPRPVPTALVIDDIGVFHPIRPVGLEDDGQLEIPDETEVGWYRYGAVPGRNGATVLAAHVTWNRTTGPFFLLRDLEPGSRIEVAMSDGTTRSYEAIERAVYDKNELPRDRIWRNTGDETLVLITCGGDYNPDIRRYRHNVVVFAVPVDHDTDDEGTG